MELPTEGVHNISASIMRDVQYESLIDHYATHFGQPYIKRIRLFIEGMDFSELEKNLPNRKKDVIKYLDEIIQINKTKQELEYKILELTKEGLEEKWKFFKYGFVSSLITGLVITCTSVSLTYILTNRPQPHQEKDIVFPKVAIIHDTVFVHK